MIQNRNMNRVLITGASGSGGSFLAEFMAENLPHIELHGLSRWHSTTAQDNLAKVKSSIEMHECDLLDFPSVLSAVDQIRPDGVFHLASHANVLASFTTPISVLNNNIIGTANLFEAIRLCGLNPWIQLCSTSEVYGKVNPEEIPITEQNPIRPCSPYAVSKAAQDMLGSTYYSAYDMPVIRTRMFTYLNPRRADLFATSFARQVAWVEAGLSSELVHGNLDSVRCILDVRDAMAAYWYAIQFGEPGEVYNIGGLTQITVGEFLELLLTKAKIPIPTRQDPALLRPADVTLQIPNTDKFTRLTGWKPQYSFEQSVEFLLDHCRKLAALAASQT